MAIQAREESWYESSENALTLNHYSVTNKIQLFTTSLLVQSIEAVLGRKTDKQRNKYRLSHKAYDKVSFYCLFNKLLDRSAPVYLVKFLAKWYSGQKKEN